MELFLFAVIAIIILIPIIYLLPLGFSKKGKNIVLITSSIIAILSLLGNLTLEWWQSILVFFLLTVLFALVIERRFSETLFAGEDVSLNNTYISNENNTVDSDTNNDKTNQVEIVITSNEDEITNQILPQNEIDSETDLQFLSERLEEHNPKFQDEQIINNEIEEYEQDEIVIEMDDLTNDPFASETIDDTDTFKNMEVNHNIVEETREITDGIDELFQNRDWEDVEDFTADQLHKNEETKTDLDIIAPEMTYLSELEQIITELELGQDEQDDDLVGALNIEFETDQLSAELQSFKADEVQDEDDDDVITPFSEEDLRK